MNREKYAVAKQKQLQRFRVWTSLYCNPYGADDRENFVFLFSELDAEIQTIIYGVVERDMKKGGNGFSMLARRDMNKKLNDL